MLCEITLTGKRLCDFLEEIEEADVPIGDAIFEYDEPYGVLTLQWDDGQPEPPPPMPETADAWTELVEQAWREHRQREKEIADDLYARSLGF